MEPFPEQTYFHYYFREVLYRYGISSEEERRPATVEDAVSKSACRRKFARRVAAGEAILLTSGKV